MPTTRLLPDAVGNRDQWTLGTGGSKTAAVQTDDGETSRIQITNDNTTNFIQLFTVDAIHDEAGVITQVDAAQKSRRSSGTNIRPRTIVRVGGTNDVKSENNNTTYTLVTDVDITRPTGGDWVIGDFPGGGSGAEIGVDNFPVDNTESARCTWLYFDVAWEGVGGFALFIGLWLPPLMAAASHGLMNMEIVKILSGLATRPSSEEDYAAIQAAFRVRPIYLFQGAALENQ